MPLVPFTATLTDLAGNPITGAHVEIRNRDTDAPGDVFLDETGLVPSTPPPTDATGSSVFWIEHGRYEWRGSKGGAVGGWEPWDAPPVDGAAGPAGPAGATGATGPQGPPGSGTGGGASFTYDQLVPSALWVIDHNLNGFPTPIVIDSGGSVVEGEIAYPTAMRVALSFSGSFAGVAHLNL